MIGFPSQLRHGWVLASPKIGSKRGPRRMYPLCGALGSVSAPSKFEASTPSRGSHQPYYGLCCRNGAIPAGTQIRVTGDSRIASPEGFRIVGENTSLEQRRIGCGTGITYVVALPRSIPAGEYVGIATRWTPVAPRAEAVRDPQPVSVDVTTGRTKTASQRTAASLLSTGQGSGGKLQWVERSSPRKRKPADPLRRRRLRGRRSQP